MLRIVCSFCIFINPFLAFPFKEFKEFWNYYFRINFVISPTASLQTVMLVNKSWNVEQTDQNFLCYPRGQIIYKTWTSCSRKPPLCRRKCVETAAIAHQDSAVDLSGRWNESGWKMVIVARLPLSHSALRLLREVPLLLYDMSLSGTLACFATIFRVWKRFTGQLILLHSPSNETWVGGWMQLRVDRNRLNDAICRIWGRVSRVKENPVLGMAGFGAYLLCDANFVF